MIPIAKPWTGEEEVEALRRVVLSGWLTQGPEVAQFEKEFAEWLGASYACAVSSGTAALHLALLTAGVKTGDEVVTVSQSFIATANAIRYCGATPVFVDTNENFNIDVSKVERVLSPKTKVILAVHQLGMPADLKNLSALAKDRGLVLVEDAACALGSEIYWNQKWEKIGKPHGDIATFSFHPRKLLTTGDGGMLTTSRKDWDEKFRLLRHQGMSVSDLERHHSKKVTLETYPVLGFNYRMTDLQGAIGQVQLKRLKDSLPRRRHLASRYLKYLGSPFELQREPSWSRSNWQSFAIKLPPHLDSLYCMEKLLSLGIATRRGVMCAHKENSYRGKYRSCHPTDLCSCESGCVSLKESESSHLNTLLLPLFPQMTEGEQDQVIDALRKIVK